MSRISGTCTALALLTIVGTVVFAEEGHPHWSYGGATGPAKWAGLEKEFDTCKLGKTQSPIDIRDADVKRVDLPAIAFDYKPSPLRIIDNGHTIQINYAPGSSITANGKQFQLVQFHFHKPSEERLNGTRQAMVAHLVHKDADGKLAVVAVLLRPGHQNALIKTLWANIPKEREKEVGDASITIDAAELLPKDRAYYTFAGSLTTPPCSEGVTWFVLRHPTSISKDDVARFAKLYPMNARPTQPLNGREIRGSK